MLLPFRGSFIATVLCRCCCWTGHCKILSPPGSPSILLCHDRNLPIDLTMAVLIDPRQLVMKRILERIHENPRQKLCKKTDTPPAGGQGPCHRQQSKTNTGTFRPMASIEDWETPLFASPGDSSWFCRPTNLQKSPNPLEPSSLRFIQPQVLHQRVRCRVILQAAKKIWQGPPKSQSVSLN